MFGKLSLIIWNFALIGWVKTQNLCTTPDNLVGNCVPLSNCSALLQISQKEPISVADKRLLKDSQCGYKERKPYVCCAIRLGNQPVKAILDTDIPDVLFPNKRSGLTDCPVQYYKNVETAVKTKHPRWQPAQMRSLGYNGIRSSVNDFPHMAAIGWTRKNGIDVDWYCGGSLITIKAVLTAAHCSTSNRARPDVIRLGDSNLYSPDDDWSAQQFKIESIIRHPNYRKSSHYDDIAIYLLNGEIQAHGIVTPACLWREDTEQFQRVEAAGWGKTEHDERSEELMKFVMEPVSNSDCSTYHNVSRKLMDGIRPTQMCAGGSHVDTCIGDSGGPLEVKLPGAWHLTPFLVGITSFGLSCGAKLPSVYTRISAYIDWIEQSLNHTIITDPIECMVRYKSSAIQYNGPKRFSDLFKSDTETKHVIQIGWSEDYEDTEKIIDNDYDTDYPSVSSKPSVEVKYNDPQRKEEEQLYFNVFSVSASWECGGVLISENYVLTSAHCLRKRDRPPDLIKTLDSQVVKISKTINHPDFDPQFYNHDIALVQLATNVNVSADGARPACLAELSKLVETNKLQMNSFGAKNILAKFLPQTAMDEVQNPVNLKVMIPLSDNMDCNKITGNLTNGLDSHYQICMKNSVTVVPGICETSLGGGVHQQLPFDGYFVVYVFAITSFGKNCGFNTPIVATKVQPYLGWINSVIFGYAPNKLAFSSYVEWVKAMFQKSATVKKTAPLLDGEKTVQKESGTIKRCAYKYIDLRENTNSKLNVRLNHRLSRQNELTHIGKLYLMKNSSDICYTTLISERHVITSVKCAESFQWKEMRLGWIQKSQYFKIAEVFLHPDYKRNVNANDLVVMKLNTTVRFSSEVQPACIWYDTELTPYELQQQIMRESLHIYNQHYAYNTDCQELYDRYKPNQKIQLNDTILCVEKDVCPKLGMAIQKMIMIADVEVPFVFGIYFQERNCALTDDRLPYLYTRLAPYVDWIESVLDK